MVTKSPVDGQEGQYGDTYYLGRSTEEAWKLALESYGNFEVQIEQSLVLTGPNGTTYDVGLNSVTFSNSGISPKFGAPSGTVACSPLVRD